VISAEDIQTLLIPDVAKWTSGGSEMAAMLTFYPRRALLEATASGQAFRVPVYRDQARILAWEKIPELRPGRVTLWEHAFELPGGEADRDVIRRVALETRNLPVCNRRTCIIVLQHWDDLRRAIAGDKRLSFSISA
jgi:hypothetical protein